MNIFELSLFIWVGSLAAGILGSITGLGGGVVIIPLLTLAFGIDIRYAVGASLVSVIATSSGAASAYVKEGFTNIRIGMFLEIATTIGALIGAFLATYISAAAVAVIFGVVLLYSSYLSYRPPPDHPDKSPDVIATYLKMNGSYPAVDAIRSYYVHNVPIGFGLMAVAGALSGLLGIGAGAFKVLAMDRAMRIPFKVSTTTSNFMIGVTAAAGAGIYLKQGYIDPGLTMPVMLGVLLGSFVGAKILIRTRTKILRLVFSAVIMLLAVEMIYKGLMKAF
jgi:uncharacterized membrane protein YfcA